ncbi:MAG: SIS domain-containing protein [Desulfovibrio sp.]|nr:SIS domain-containing protein [Desulfovibrio sp.]
MGIYVDQCIARLPQLAPQMDAMEAAVEMIVAAILRGNKVMTCGNGGSAADAEHIVAELMKGFLLPRKLPPDVVRRLRESGCPEELACALQQGIPAISLVGGVALPTAFANDVKPEYVFAQQVYALGHEGDVLLALSTSGNSPNVLAALQVARALGMGSIGLTGGRPCAMADLVEVHIAVAETETARIQELHLPVYHALCADVERQLFGEGE